MAQYIQIQWTSATLEEARTIARAIVEKKLAACANIIPEVESIFSWNGKIETAKEVKVFFKTQDKHFFAIRDYIIANGSYETPEVSKVLIADGNPAYLKWVLDNT